jgi:hypothetical protein
MSENHELDKGQINALLELQDSFSKAHPSQDLMDDIPDESLPLDYRPHILLRMDRDNFYVAFSDNEDDLLPTNEGFLPNAHIKQVSAMTGPKRVGLLIKRWIDKTRKVESEQK